MGGGDVNGLCQLVHRDPIHDVDVDVVDGLCHLLGGGDVLLQPPHPAHVVKGHLIMDIYNLRHVVAAVHPPDILVAEAERLLHRHTALHAEASQHRRRDHEVITEIGDGVLRELPRSLQVLKRAPAAVVLHSVNESCRHGAVEQELLAGLPVAARLPLAVNPDRLPALG